MPTIYDINPSVLIKLASAEIKKFPELKMPKWAMFVKTSSGKDRLPDDPEWWYLRVASVLRKCAVHGPIGVNKLKVKYGCKKNRGVKPEKFRKGSGKIIRVVMQQLENKGFLKKGEKGGHKGRVITPEGLKFLNNLTKDGKSTTKTTGAS